MEDMVRCMIMPDMSDPFINNFHVSKLLLYILNINLRVLLPKLPACNINDAAFSVKNIVLILIIQLQVLYEDVQWQDRNIFIWVWCQDCHGGGVGVGYDSVTDPRLDDIIDSQCQCHWYQSIEGSCNFRIIINTTKSIFQNMVTC